MVVRPALGDEDDEGSGGQRKVVWLIAAAFAVLACGVVAAVVRLESMSREAEHDARLFHRLLRQGRLSEIYNMAGDGLRGAGSRTSFEQQLAVVTSEMGRCAEPGPPTWRRATFGIGRSTVELRYPVTCGDRRWQEMIRYDVSGRRVELVQYDARAEGVSLSFPAR